MSDFTELLVAVSALAAVLAAAVLILALTGYLTVKRPTRRS